jgi:hypothetical protein
MRRVAAPYPSSVVDRKRPNLLRRPFTLAAPKVFDARVSALKPVANISKHTERAFRDRIRA